MTCSLLADEDRAAMLYEILLPYASGNVILGAFGSCAGWASQHLGLLAATMSRLDAQRALSTAQDLGMARLERNASELLSETA